MNAKQRWQWENYEKYLAAIRSWKARNPDKQREYARRYRQKIKLNNQGSNEKVA